MWTLPRADKEYKRALVLCLRAFGTDERYGVWWWLKLHLMGHVLLERTTQEEAVTGFLRRIGPVIAFGSPWRKSSATWCNTNLCPKRRVAFKGPSFIYGKQGIVFRVSPGHGVEWEMEQALKSLDPQRLIFWFMNRYSYMHFRRRFPTAVQAKSRTRCDFWYFNSDNHPQFVTVTLRFGSLAQSCSYNGQLALTSLSSGFTREVGQKSKRRFAMYGCAVPDSQSARRHSFLRRLAYSGSYAQAPCAPRGGHPPDARPFALYLPRVCGVNRRRMLSGAPVV